MTFSNCMPNFFKKVPVCLTCTTLHTKQFKSSHKTWICVIVLATFHFGKLHQTPIETPNLSSSLHQWEIQWVDGGLWSWRPLCTGCRVKMLLWGHCWQKQNGCQEHCTCWSAWRKSSYLLKCQHLTGAYLWYILHGGRVNTLPPASLLQTSSGQSCATAV